MKVRISFLFKITTWLRTIPKSRELSVLLKYTVLKINHEKLTNVMVQRCYSIQIIYCTVSKHFCWAQTSAKLGDSSPPSNHNIDLARLNSARQGKAICIACIILPLDPHPHTVQYFSKWNVFQLVKVLSVNCSRHLNAWLHTNSMHFSSTIIIIIL